MMRKFYNNFLKACVEYGKRRAATEMRNHGLGLRYDI